MRGKRIVAPCFLSVPELMGWISVRKFAVLVAFLYSPLQGKYNVVPDLHQFTIHNNPFNADGRIGKYRCMQNNSLKNSIYWYFLAHFSRV